MDSHYIFLITIASRFILWYTREREKLIRRNVYGAAGTNVSAADGGIYIYIIKCEKKLLFKKKSFSKKCKM